MQMDDMILVSIDDHMIEPPDMYKNHLPAKWLDKAPKVVRNAQGVDECFIPSGTGMAIPFGDRQAFRAAIQRFADGDPARRQCARDFARHTFDPTRQVQAYLDLFAKLLQS